MGLADSQDLAVFSDEHHLQIVFGLVDLDLKGQPGASDHIANFSDRFEQEHFAAPPNAIFVEIRNQSKAAGAH